MTGEHTRHGILAWMSAFVVGLFLAAAGAVVAYFTTHAFATDAGATVHAARLLPPRRVSAAEGAVEHSGAVSVAWAPPPTQLHGATYAVFEGAARAPLCTTSNPPCTVIGLHPATTYSFKVEAVLRSWRSSPRDVTFTTLGVTTTSLPTATVGKIYANALNATGGTPSYTWSLTGKLPTGLSLQPTGEITGTPTTSGTYHFVAKVTDTNTVTATSTILSITVQSVTPQPS